MLPAMSVAFQRFNADRSGVDGLAVDNRPRATQSPEPLSVHGMAATTSPSVWLADGAGEVIVTTGGVMSRMSANGDNERFDRILAPATRALTP